MIDISWAVLAVIFSLIAGVGIGSWMGFNAGFLAAIGKATIRCVKCGEFLPGNASGSTDMCSCD